MKNIRGTNGRGVSTEIIARTTAGSLPHPAQRGTGTSSGGGPAQQVGRRLNVWAPHNGVGAAWRGGGGWHQVLSAFSTMPELIANLRAEVGTGQQIGHLGIVAHGDRPGRVMFNIALETSSHQAQIFFRHLSALLKPDAHVTFFSCIAAAGDRGDRLLQRISTALPGRRVSGFITFGYINHAPTGLTAGRIFDILTTSYPSQEPRGRLPLMSLSRPSLKQALNGRIVRRPNLRQLWQDVRQYRPALANRATQLAFDSHSQSSSRYFFQIPPEITDQDARARYLARARARHIARYGLNSWPPRNSLQDGDGRTRIPRNPVYDSPFLAYVSRFLSEN